MKTYFAPQKPNTLDQTFKIFLAGTIDLGNSENWQSKLTDDILINVAEYHEEYPISFFNPRRPDWDNSIKQDINDPRFAEQVNWELDMLESVDLIVMHLLPKSLSPISLLEFGFFSCYSPEKLIIFCDDDFWRKGNVDIVAQRQKVEVATNWNGLVQAIKNRYTSSVEPRLWRTYHGNN